MGEGKCKVTSTVLTLNEDKAIDKAGDALTGCHLVLVPAGVPRKPGQDRKDLLTINADIAKGTVEACAKYCPNAVVALIVNPVNSVVPAMTELWKKAGLNPKKICGITTLDVVRANKFVQEITGKPAQVPVMVDTQAKQFCRFSLRMQLAPPSTGIRFQTSIKKCRMLVRKSWRLKTEKEVQHFLWLTQVRV